MLRAGVLVAVLLAAATAHADDKAAKRRAGELAAEAAQHYKRGEFEVSAALVRQAYALYPEPNLLYNLARSLEGMGDKKGAVDAYEQYLAQVKDVEDRGAIERRVATLKAELEAGPPTSAEPVARPAPTPTLTAPAPAPVVPASVIVTPPPEERSPPSLLPVYTIVLGAATAAAGGTFGYLASNRHDAATSATSALDAQSLQHTAQTYAAVANILFVAGGALAIGGIVWEIHEHGKSHVPPGAVARMRVAPGAVGLEVAW